MRVFSFFVKVKAKKPLCTLHTCHESSDPRCSRIEIGRRIVHIKAPISSFTAKAGIPLFTVPFLSLVFVLLPHPPQHNLSQAEWLFQTHFTATSLTNIPLPCVPPPLLSMWHVCDLSLSLWACGCEYINMCYDFQCWAVWKHLLSTWYKAVFCLGLSELLLIDV